MKVLHISVNDFMGAGLSALRINDSLQKLGIDSKMLVMLKHSDNETVFQTGKCTYFFQAIINRFLYVLNLTFTDSSKCFKLSRKNFSIYSLPISNLDLSEHPLVKEADIIHLHWINGFIDQPSFFEKVKKPMVWTLHDENLFYGIAHYESSVLNENFLERKYNDIKIESIKKINNLGIVFLSEYFFDKYSESERISNALKCIIYNSVDYRKYKPFNKNVAREEMGLNKDDIFILFIAYDITEQRKGLDKLIKALKVLNCNEIKILAIGKCDNFIGDSKVITLGPINTPLEMSKAISSADIFVMPSLHEAFAQAPIEAMACGLPVVAFPVSGTKELINESNGIVCEGFTVDDLVSGIRIVLSRQYDNFAIRENIIQRFSPKVIAENYLSFYNKLLN